MLEEKGRRKGKRNSEGGSPLWGGGCLAPTLPFRPSGFLSRSTQVTLLCKLPNLRESLLFQVTLNPFLILGTESIIGSAQQAPWYVCFLGLDTAS